MNGDVFEPVSSVCCRPADDTAAIVAAIAAAGAYDPKVGEFGCGNTVLFPPGIYMISRTVQLPNRVALQGQRHQMSSSSFSPLRSIASSGQRTESLSSQFAKTDSGQQQSAQTVCVLSFGSRGEWSRGDDPRRTRKLCWELHVPRV